MSEKVLFVDDEKPILRSLGRLFRHSPFDLLVASSGQEALDIIESLNDLAVIISDQKMPDIDGLTVLKKCNEKHPDAVRIALTGYCDINNIIACMNEAHVSHFITKPWEDEYLKTIIENAVKTHISSKENEKLVSVITEQNLKLEQLNKQLEIELQKKNQNIENDSKEIDHFFNCILNILSEIAEIYTNCVTGHCKRVAEICVEIGKKAGFQKDELQELRASALLHDLGLVLVPRSILEKPVKAYRKEELETFHKHPVTAFNWLKEIPGFEKISINIRHHHENIDGTGYPDQLAGEKIPLLSRIISVADYYDSCMHPNENLVKSGSLEVTKEMWNVAGKVLDQNIVELFLDNQIESSKRDDEIGLTIDQIRPGMKVSRDFVTPQGSKLLAKDLLLNLQEIKKLHLTNFPNGYQPHIFIYTHSIAQPEDQDDDNAAPLFLVGNNQEWKNTLEQQLKLVNIQCLSYNLPFEVLTDIPKHKQILGIIAETELSGINGESLINLIQSQYKSLPCFILLTEDQQDQYDKYKELAGVTDIITQPWNRQIITNLIKDLPPFKLSV